MDDIIESAIKSYIKTLEKKNETLKSFLAEIEYAFAFTGENKSKSDSETMSEVYQVLKRYDLWSRDFWLRNKGD